MALCAITVLAITAYAVTLEPLAQGTIAYSELLKGPAVVTVVKITLQPGDVIPWHYHPGKAYVVVQSGAITEDNGCGGSEVIGVGQAFEEALPRVHQVRNAGTETAVLFATLMVPPGQPLTIFTGGPMCGPPTMKDQCQYNGWMTFSFPRSFENQGDCISYVNTGK
jgi:quercetin dioxygenase-like cupin family protein